MNKIEKSKRPAFKTKLQLLIEMAREVFPLLETLNIPIQLLFDCGYVSEEVFTEMAELGVEIVWRLKSNTNLYTLPDTPKEKRRGRPQKYGKSMKAEEIMLDKRRKLTYLLQQQHLLR